MNTYLFFDTETASFVGPILQLAWILTNENGEVIHENSTLLNHSIDYEIHEGAFEIHGITKEMCATGRDAVPELDTLLKIMDGSNQIIAHNLSFDWDMVKKDLERYKSPLKMPDHTKAFCTMKSTTDLLQLPGKYGYKWPKLQELHQYLFDCEFEDAHDALADVRATAKCYFELQKRGII